MSVESDKPSACGTGGPDKASTTCSPTLCLGHPNRKCVIPKSMASCRNVESLLHDRYGKLEANHELPNLPSFCELDLQN